MSKSGKAISELGRTFGKKVVFVDAKEGPSPGIGEVMEENR